MNEIIDSLTPMDFGMPMDPTLFDNWKTAKKNHLGAAKMTMVLYLVGFACLLLLGGIVGLALFFGAMITALVLTIPKKKKVDEAQKLLGLTNNMVNEAIKNKRQK